VLRENLISDLKNYFIKNKLHKTLAANQVFICRGDGQVIYKNQKYENELDSLSIGALIGGVWQASSALSAFLPESPTGDNFRLSFDTSSRGIYILSCKIDDKEYYLGCIFTDTINPGQLKLSMRELKKHINNEFPKSITKIENKKKADFLFSNISDKEVDDMFSSVGV
jgi:hypothetical protein